MFWNRLCLLVLWIFLVLLKVVFYGVVIVCCPGWGGYSSSTVFLILIWISSHLFQLSPNLPFFFGSLLDSFLYPSPQLPIVFSFSSKPLQYKDPLPFENHPTWTIPQKFNLKSILHLNTMTNQKKTTINLRNDIAKK